MVLSDAPDAPPVDCHHPTAMASLHRGIVQAPLVIIVDLLFLFG
jgi:hypothetical protein